MASGGGEGDGGGGMDFPPFGFQRGENRGGLFWLKGAEWIDKLTDRFELY